MKAICNRVTGWGPWVVWCAFLSAACGKNPKPHVQTHHVAANRQITLSGPSAAYVRTESAVPATRGRSRTLAARVSFDERHVARVGAPIQGRVQSIQVVTGDRVQAGTVLLTISAPDLASAQDQVSQARNAREQAERVAERARVLVKEGAGSLAEQQQAESALSHAKNEEQRAVASLAAIGGAQGTTGFALRAPMAGTVVERNVAVGGQVSASQEQPLLTIADLSTVWIVADVYEQDLPRVQKGDQADISVLALPDRRFVGTIDYVGSVVDLQTRTAQARIEFKNDDLALRPGMFARMDVHGKAEGVSEVPSSAILARRDQYFVFVRQKDGTYLEREVHVGDQHGQHTTILSGLVPGEDVVTEGAILLDAEAHEAL